MLKNKAILVLVCSGLALGSCKKFLDVNQNPNVSPTTTVKTLLPAAELYLASGVGVDLQVAGSFWSQYWTQNPAGNHYNFLDQYSPTQDYFNNAWTNLYAANENFYQLENIADSQYAGNYAAIALLMQAYTFQVITDAWGDVPFKTALKGQYLNGHMINPTFDSQKVVYQGILTYCDSAIKMMKSSAGITPGADDLIYGGNMSKWQKFAYTLKLKTIMRMSLVDPVTAQADLVTLYNSPGLAFIGMGDDAAVKFTSGGSNANPLYAEQSGIGNQNFAASATIIDSMTNNYDTARMKVFFEPGAAGGYMGIQQGDYYATVVNYSVPNVYVAGDLTNAASGGAPVNLLTSYESLFLQAEVVARGWIAPGPSDATLFYNGIQASFNYYNNQIISATGITGAMAYSNYVAGGASGVNYPVGGSVNQKVRYITLQKWYAMCGNQSFEAWTELRRTGLDSILTPSVNSSIGAVLPKRCLYPSIESSTNANFPGLMTITSKEWWDLY